MESSSVPSSSARSNPPLPLQPPFGSGAPSLRSRRPGGAVITAAAAPPPPPLSHACPNAGRLPRLAGRRFLARRPSSLLAVSHTSQVSFQLRYDPVVQVNLLVSIQQTLL
ncbi:hypothetical protein EJB05_37403, partial [Eragrostis curvula]